MRQRLVAILKIGIPLLVIVWLVASIDASQWHELGDRPIHWRSLLAALGIESIAVCLTFVRWYFLVRSLGIGFSLADAFRLSVLGYLFNFVSVGSVGGDLFKAFFIAREQPGRRTEAVATVVIDRIIGMYALMLVASLAILLGGVRTASPVYRALTQVVLVATATGGCALLAAMMPGMTEGRIARALVSLPRIGGSCERLFTSFRVYRERRCMMAAIFCVSMLVHALHAASVFAIAGAIFDEFPPLIEHLVIVPLGMVAGALPFTPSGLGTFELAMDELFRLASGDAGGEVSGVLIALVYRLVTIAIAALGVIYYWTCPIKVDEMLEAAEATH